MSLSSQACRDVGPVLEESSQSYPQRMARMLALAILQWGHDVEVYTLYEERVEDVDINEYKKMLQDLRERFPTGTIKWVSKFHD
eukprot:4454249-Karenia_brevis.AAC.1